MDAIASAEREQLHRVRFELGDVERDEFAALAVRGSTEGVRAIPARLEKAVVDANTATRRSYELSISVGSMYFEPSTRLTVDEMMTKADQAMYEQKRKKNQH